MSPLEKRTRARRSLEKKRKDAQQDSNALASGKAAFRRIMGSTENIDEWFAMAVKAADKIADDCNAAIRKLEEE